MIDYETNTVIKRNGIRQRRSNGCTAPPPFHVKGGHMGHVNALNHDPKWHALIASFGSLTFGEVEAAIAGYARDRITDNPRRAIAAAVVLKDLPRLAALWRPKPKTATTERIAPTTC